MVGVERERAVLEMKEKLIREKRDTTLLFSLLYLKHTLSDLVFFSLGRTMFKLRGRQRAQPKNSRVSLNPLVGEKKRLK